MWARGRGIGAVVENKADAHFGVSRGFEILKVLQKYVMNGKEWAS